MVGLEPSILLFAFMGFLGGLTHALIVCKTFFEFRRYKGIKLITIGAIVGVVYYMCYSEWNFPNGVMAFISGYAGPSFIESLTLRVRGKS